MGRRPKADTKATARLEMRLTPEHKAELQEAARFDGDRPVAEYVLDRALKAARRESKRRPE